MKICKHKLTGRILETQFGVMLLLLFSSVAFADRVCLEKSTGKLLEFQSGDAPLGTLTQNQVNGGYNKDDIEEKYVNKEEWQVIEEEQIRKPAKEKEKQQRQEKEKQQRQEKAQKEEAFRVQIGWTAEQLTAFKELLDK